MPVDKFGRMSDTKTKDTGVSLTYINNNYVRSDGETPLTGSLNMRGNTIYNVADPVNPQDVVTKVYVDKMDNLNSTFSFRDGGYYAKGDIYLGKNKLGGLRKPLQDGEAANKKNEVDTTKNLFINENDNIAIGSNIDMEGNKIFSLPEPEQDNEPATKKYVDDLQTQHIDKRGNVKFDRNINMNFHNIRNLGLPKDEADAVPRSFVDNMIKEVEEKINKRKHLIAVHARYCGPLEEGEYPFKFGGGNSLENCKELIGGLSGNHIKSTLSGFVIPHPGQLRKIICEGVTYIDLNKMINKLINSFNEEQINELKKYFGKEDFKKDLLEKIKSSVDFTTDKINERPLQEGKTFFEITSTSKSFSGDDKTLVFFDTPTIFSTAIIKKVKWKEVELSSSVNVIRAIMKIIYFSEKGRWYSSFKEGDTLNIRISDFKKNFFGKGELIDNILKPIVIFLLGILNFNFTFLIELDPL